MPSMPYYSVTLLTLDTKITVIMQKLRSRNNEPTQEVAQRVRLS